MAILTPHNPRTSSIGVHRFLSHTAVTLSNSSGNLLAFAFVAPKNPFTNSMTLNGVRVYFSASTSGQVTPYLYSDNNGEPGAITGGLLATGTESAAITGGTWVDLGGFTYALTEGTMYWIVLECTTGTSAAVRYMAYGTQASSSGSIDSSRATTFGQLVDQSTAGATWDGTASIASGGIRINLADGTNGDLAYYGYPCSSGAADASRANGTVSTGFEITIPSDGPSLKIKGVHLYLAKTGAPGNLTVKIYQGTNTSVITNGTSLAIPAANISTVGVAYLFTFSETLTLTAGTAYRIVISAASGDSSNYYAQYIDTADTDSDSNRLYDNFSQLPYTLSGTTWSAGTTGAKHWFNLSLDSTDPFTMPAGGGGRPEIRGSNL